MKTVTSYASWFTEATSKAAKEAFEAFRVTGCAPHYLYFKPNGLSFVVVQDETKEPEGYELVTNERIPSDRTIDQLTSWIRQYAGKVPVLPGD